ncbi:hypothetical protein CRP01_10250 [Flavilitoribacter nigricans DSM 23189 = NBRC 102662]|uniref:T9SS C-terminal target domain-containing protein n=1 Tax=Flavilitoribacter nigricans (strain ATCC 23147 / DSM 23189 / NBRC 102662 / NCIMB 1420 / SS-2) TaxID=1122177 RepID=A0A2D0NE36_FLAN2|nr:hypothetical protein CRP01_10250 [Flavilitoribacter nigricans DSM 23189 = NBRC 102662]
MFLLSLLSVPSFGQQKPKKRFKLPPQLSEASGLYIAGPDSLWWHNDSGDGPMIYLTDGRGKLLRIDTLSHLQHIDWEDITSDDQGRIYIGDFGNNANARQNLKIYRYDLEAGTTDSLSFAYEDQKQFPPPPEWANFDMEAFFWMNDSLHLFSKNRLRRGNYQCKHYVLADDPGEQVARLQDSIYLRKRVITGAAISPDGKTMALVGYNFKMCLGFFPSSAASLFVFKNFNGSRFFEGEMERKSLSCFFATQYESVDFIDNNQVYVASEKTVIIPPRAKRRRVRKADKKESTLTAIRE